MADRFARIEHGPERWRQFLHDLHTPPPEAFRDPATRAATVEKYRRLRAAEPPKQ